LQLYCSSYSKRKRIRRQLLLCLLLRAYALVAGLVGQQQQQQQQPIRGQQVSLRIPSGT
jgi:hypothetical protein